jgi:Galactose oxidase, central domain
MDETRIERALREGPPFATHYVDQPLPAWSAAPARPMGWLLFGVALLLALAIGGAILIGSGIFHSVRPSAWTVTGSMVEPRVRHTATLLPDGRVLAVGGGQFNGFSDLASAELYDPITGAWSATGTMAEVRWGHTATLLPDGTVLVAGGRISGNSPALASAELYDPRSGTWSSVGAMIEARRDHTGTLLPSGRVLVTGGYDADGALASAELYDPASKSWTATGAMLTGRLLHTATLLQDGKVLVAGGLPSIGGTLASAELYDPETGSWSPTGALDGARGGQTATLLPDGTVLIAGGIFGSQRSSFDALATAEVYDPAAGVWNTVESMHTDRQDHTATLLPDGTVLIAGGNFGAENTATAEVYDPAHGTWSAIGDMHEARAGHSATLLPNGNVLVAGWTAEQYGPAAVPPHSTEPQLSMTPGESATPVFADQGPVTCTNTESGYSIQVPAGWWYLITNDSCGYLDPEPFTFVDATPQGPVAIRISVVQGSVGSVYEILSSEQMSIAGLPATRWEVRAGGEEGGPPAGTLIYEYIVQLGATPEGPNLVAHTESVNQPDYEQNKLVLDAIMATLTTP